MAEKPEVNEAGTTASDTNVLNPNQSTKESPIDATTDTVGSTDGGAPVPPLTIRRFMALFSLVLMFVTATVPTLLISAVLCMLPITNGS
jgi:hypothetical protein